MASYIAAADGNFNTGATWGLVDGLLDSETGSTEPAAGSYTESSAFQVAAANYDGIAVKLADAGTGAYTITAHIFQTGVGEVAGSAVTINRADLCAATAANNQGGWVFFKFASPVALAAATNYSVGLQESDAACNVLFYRDGTAGNWSRMLRSTTAAASPPAATSILHIMEEKTGAGAATTRTVTMDAIATSITKYGSGTDGTVALTISDGGTLAYAYTAATNYYLQLDGNLIVYGGGTLTIGTVANPIPRGGTAVLEFDPTADAGMGLIVRNEGTFTAQGLSRTSGKNVVSGLLSVDTVNGEGHFHLDTDSGWLSGDVVAIATTTRTVTSAETKTLNGDAGASICNVTANFGATIHLGTSPTQAEVILLTRNVKIRSTSATVMMYFNSKATSIVDLDWVEFYYLGDNTTSKYGMTLEATTGSFNMAYCSLHDFEDNGIYDISASGSNISITYCTMYNLNSQSQSNGSVLISVTSGITVFDHNVLVHCGCSTATGIIYWSDVGSTFTNNRVAGSPSTNPCGLFMSERNVIGSFSDNVFHSLYQGIYTGKATNFQYGVYDSTITNTTIWRTNDFGLYALGLYNVTFNGITLFGCTTSSICNFDSWITIINGVSNGDSSFSTTNGLSSLTTVGGNGHLVKLLNCDFSTVSGIKTAHTNDINIVQAGTHIRIEAYNCKFGGTNQVANSAANFMSLSYVKSSKHHQSTGASKVDKSWFKYGIVETDLTVYNTAVPSMKATPNSATAYVFEVGSFKVNVNSGQTVTPHVFVRQSEAAEGDSADYNGSKPRLVLKRNDAIGITADAVIDTATNAIGSPWEELTAAMASPASENGVAEFVIQCDGTTGFINIDDFSATVA